MTPCKVSGARRRQRLQVTNPDAAGIDVGADAHWVCVPEDRAAEQVQRFGTCTADLEAIADWLQACAVTTVAMESTGVYWVPLYELLEGRGFHVLLVDARQVARAPGRPKTDVKDCQWIQRLHSYGLLSAAFRPQDQVVVLRAYLRQRDMLVTYAGQHIQHMQKALEQMNVKLTEVVSDITGVTGMSIIKAILRGRRDPQQLAKLRDPRCKESEATIARALLGNWRPEHLFALQQGWRCTSFITSRSAPATRPSKRTSGRSRTKAAVKCSPTGRDGGSAKPTSRALMRERGCIVCVASI